MSNEPSQRPRDSAVVLSSHDVRTKAIAPSHACAGPLFALQAQGGDRTVREDTASQPAERPEPEVGGVTVSEDDTIFSPHFHPMKSGSEEKSGATDISSGQEDSASSAPICASEGQSFGVCSPLTRCTSASVPLPPAGTACEPPADAIGSSSLDWVGDDLSADDDDVEAVDFDPFLFIKRLPKLSDVVPPFRRPLLPKQTRSSPAKTLVLDLDETLVHSTMEVSPGADFWFPVSFNNHQHEVYVRIRPHLFEFLDRASQLFEVVVFTASQSVYADKLLSILDPKRRRVRHRLFRDSCVFVEGNYLKDLSNLGRDLSNVAIVDNSPQAFGFQVDNGIPIDSWFEDKADKALLDLLAFLETLIYLDDVRPAIAARFRLKDRIERACAVPLRRT